MPDDAVASFVVPGVGHDACVESLTRHRGIVVRKTGRHDRNSHQALSGEWYKNHINHTHHTTPKAVCTQYHITTTHAWRVLRSGWHVFGQNIFAWRSSSTIASLQPRSYPLSTIVSLINHLITSLINRYITDKSLHRSWTDWLHRWSANCTADQPPRRTVPTVARVSGSIFPQT